MTCRLMGHKQTRKMRGRSVSQAHLQSFDGMSLLDIHLATKRVSHLSVGSELSLFGMSHQLCLMHSADDGSDLFNGDVTNDRLGSTGFVFLVTLLPNLVTLFKGKFVPFHHRIKSGCIRFAFVGIVVITIVTASMSATMTAMPTAAIVTAAMSPRTSVSSVLIRSIG